jgi:hypothetical protein
MVIIIFAVCSHIASNLKSYTLFRKYLISSSVVKIGICHHKADPVISAPRASPRDAMHVIEHQRKYTQTHLAMLLAIHHFHHVRRLFPKT